MKHNIHLSKIYLRHAKAVCRKNRYTCLMFSLTERIEKARYQNRFSPSGSECSGYFTKSGVKPKEFWWSTDVYGKNKTTVYAHKARVFALLLASEMAKTGDMYFLGK